MIAPDDISVCRAVAANLRGEVVHVQPLTGGEANRVFSVDLTSGMRVVVRLEHRYDGYAPTVDTIAALKGIGASVPDVLRSGLYGELSYIVLTWTPGVELRWALASLTASQKTGIAEQIVGVQRRVMTLPEGTGFGWIGIGQRAKFPTWSALIGGHQNSAKAPSDLLEHLDAVRPVCFLDDITGKNVLIDSGALAGLIDLDGVCYGDPLYWLALTIVGLVSDIGHDFYADELVRLWGGSPFEHRVLGLYAALICDDFIAKYAKANPSHWLERMQSARTAWWHQATKMK